MHKALRTSATIVLAGVLALVVAACGSSSSSSSTSSGSSSSGSSGGQTPAGQVMNDGKKGGTLTIYNHEDFQSLDTGQAYFSGDYQPLYSTERPLYSFLPNNQLTQSPDLATAQPVVSDAGKTVTVHIKSGVHFGPPVNREVNSGDVAYAVERAANPNVPNGYFKIYFGKLAGADKATGGPLAGVSTPDAHTIVFHLTAPTASILIGALGLPITMPVPPEFAKPLDKAKPTKYGSYLISSGPYMFKSDCPQTPATKADATNCTGKILGNGYQVGKSAVLVRNPNWVASTDFRPAYLDQINFNIGGDPPVIGRQVLSGSAVVQGDTPAQAVVKLAAQQHPKQIIYTPGSGNRFITLNNKKGPFANVNVRRAFFAALNRAAMVKARGGALIGTPATHFLYPGVNGFDQAGGNAGPALDFVKNPNGDMTVAAKYMKAAGYPSGKYTGGKTLTVLGSTGNPASVDAQIVNQTLQNLGFKTTFTTVDQPVMYSKCGTPALEIDVCPNIGWIRDFADPQTVLDPVFNGKVIQPANSQNQGQVDDPQINAAMAKAELVVGDAARAQAWANVDSMLVNQAVAVPWEWDNQPNIEAADVRGISDVWDIGTWDLSFSSLK